MLNSLGQLWHTISGALHPDRLTGGVVLLVAFLVSARLLQWFARKVMHKARVDIQVTLLITRLVYLGIVTIGVIGFFSVWLDNLTLTLSSFGIFALAFSLAFQDILKNFISGVFLLLERPFRIGDEITVDGHTGAVESIEVRTTTMRTADGEEVLIPNSIVYTQTIINRTRYPTRLFTLTAKVPAGVPLDGLAQRLRDQLAARQELAKEPPPHIGLQPSIDGGLTLEVRYWLDYRRNDPLAVQAAVGQQIYQAIQANQESTTGTASREAT